MSFHVKKEGANEGFATIGNRKDISKLELFLKLLPDTYTLVNDWIII